MPFASSAPCQTTNMMIWKAPSRMRNSGLCVNVSTVTYLCATNASRSMRLTQDLPRIRSFNISRWYSMRISLARKVAATTPIIIVWVRAEKERRLKSLGSHLRLAEITTMGCLWSVETLRADSPATCLVQVVRLLPMKASVVEGRTHLKWWAVLRMTDFLSTITPSTSVSSCVNNASKKSKGLRERLTLILYL